MSSEDTVRNDGGRQVTGEPSPEDIVGIEPNAAPQGRVKDSRLKTALALALTAVTSLVLLLHGRPGSRSPDQTSLQMRSSVAAIRKALLTYRARHHDWPQHLQDLVHDGELAALPDDPVTGSAATWKTTIEERVTLDDFRRTTPEAAVRTGAIIDVHSGASGVDSHGKHWSDY